MSAVVVALLGGLWASILLPGALQARRENRPISSVHSFERSMSMLAGPARSPSGRRVLVLNHPATVAGKGSRARTARRRRTALARLALAVLATGALAAVLGGLAWLLFAAAVLGLGLYVLLLVEARAREVERRRKVRAIRPPARRVSATRPAPPSARRGVVADAATARPRRRAG